MQQRVAQRLHQGLAAAHRFEIARHRGQRAIRPVIADLLGQQFGDLRQGQRRGVAAQAVAHEEKGIVGHQVSGQVMGKVHRLRS